MIDQVTVETIEKAAKNLEGVAKNTPLQFSRRLSNIYGAKIYLKREDLQTVRSYKIRGAFNKINSLSTNQAKKGVVCASAGNHAQGVAFSASLKKIKAVIFMPVTTPLQKINKVKHFGGKWVQIKLSGTTFDESNQEAKKMAAEFGMSFIPPFDDYDVISGQGTVGKEIFDQLGDYADFILCPIGGGGLISGVSTYFKQKCPEAEIIGVEPAGAAGMYESLENKKVTSLAKLDTFVDGAAVKTIGEKSFAIVSKNVKKILVIPVGKVCTTMIDLYQNDGIITEPAGALTVSALDLIAREIKGKTVVCVVSGGNNDILRYPEIMEKSLVYLGLKYYFLIEFAQKPGQLRQFVDKALGPTDDISRFEYIKKSAKEKGPALIGIEVTKKQDFPKLLKRMERLGLKYTILKESDLLYSYLI